MVVCVTFELAVTVIKLCITGASEIYLQLAARSSGKFLLSHSRV